MLRSATGFVSKQVEHLINQINAEGSRYDRELRSVHREKVIIPAEIEFESGETLTAFTRNLSAHGVCLISCKEIQPEFQTTLKLYRLSEPPSSIFAECRWSKAFGDQYWVSGWKFLQLKRDN